MNAFLAAWRKEALLQWRGRAQLGAVFVFGATTLLLFSFGAGPDGTALRLLSPAFLWLAILLASTLSLQESYRAELDHMALEGQLLLPVPAAALYYAKALANWLLLALLGVALTPLLIVLFDAPLPAPVPMLAVLALGAGGLSAPGTLHAAMATRVRARGLLLPLLLFPLVVPVLIGSVRATHLILFGDPMNQLNSWLLLLLAFNLVFWSLCGVVYSAVVED
jgi:heme exporter protein B